MKPPAPSSLQRPATELGRAVRSLRPYFMRSLCFTLVASLLVLMSSWYMLEVYDRVVNSRNHFTLAMLTLMVLASFVLMEILEWAHGQEMHEAGQALDAKLGNRVFTASFEANLRRMPGGSVQPLQDLRAIRDFLPSPVLRGALEAPVALVFLAVIFAISPSLGWAALLGALAQSLIAWANGSGTSVPLTAAGKAAVGAQQYVNASVRNAKVIRAMGMLGDIHQRWSEKQREFLGLHALASRRAAAFNAATRFLQTLMGSLLLGLAAWLLLRNQLPGGAGTMIVASILGGRVLQPFVQVVTQWRSAVYAREAWQRLEALFAAVPERQPGMALPRPRGQLAVENILAAAPGSQVPILRGISFRLEPGEVLAVSGPSASGKTSLARVLVGVWPSAGGRARLDGADIHSWDKAELGPHVGYLPQDVELFEGSFAENIARFGEVDMARVEHAARVCGLHDFIVSRAAGYDTSVGPEGEALSGGQRQRVGLARALYGDPVFVVLDEPNSSLDEEGEASLAQAVREYKARGTTFVIVTHRISVLAVADKLLLMADGMVQAFGPRDEVMAALSEAREKAAQARPRIQQRPEPQETALATPEAAQ